MNPLDLITGNLWKAATVSALALAAGLGIALTVTNFEKAAVEHQVKVLQASIDDPKTGYVAKLAQSETNTLQVRADLDKSNQAIDAMSAVDTAKLADMSKQVAAASAANRKSQDRLAVFMAAPPKGADVCTQSQDIDGRVVEMFK